ncbi:hypothetical protein WJX77_009971 [Trebouxia sp. C0004]
MRAGKVLELLQGIGQPNTSLLDLEARTAAHEELSKQARLEMQHIATCVNYQFRGHEEGQLLNLITPDDLKFDQFAEEHSVVFLHGRPPKPADLVVGGTASGPLHFSEEQNMAGGPYCLHRRSPRPEHVSSISKLLKATQPPVEPVLSLIVTVLCGKAHSVHDMAVSLFMRDEQNIKCNERSLEQLGCREEVNMSSSLADLLSHNDKDAVKKAFNAHDLDGDGPSSTEARIWVATLAVAARAVPEVTDAPDASLDSVSIQQSVDDSTQLQLPTVSASQSAVANDIILRILLSKGFMEMHEPDNYKKGLERLRARYRDGLDFIVLTPVLVTLRQQTLQRLQDAGLKSSDGSDPKVLTPLADFTQSAEGLNDAYVNDLKWRSGTAEPKHGAWQSKATSCKFDFSGDWSRHDNLITLLVSATPANVLTADSRIPRQYYVPKEVPDQQLQQYSVIKPTGGALESARLANTLWECRHKAVSAECLQSLIKHKVVRELHVIDWSDAKVVKVPYKSM